MSIMIFPMVPHFASFQWIIIILNITFISYKDLLRF